MSNCVQCQIKPAKAGAQACAECHTAEMVGVARQALANDPRVGGAAAAATDPACRQLNRDQYCDYFRSGTATCDLKQFLGWIDRSPEVVVSGDISSGVAWTVNDDGTKIARIFQTPILGDYCFSNITLTVGGTVSVATVSLVPIEIAVEPDGANAGVNTNVVGRFGGVNSEVIAVKDGRCACRPVCSGCTWPMAANGSIGGFLLILEFTAAPNPLSVVEFRGQLSRNLCDDFAEVCEPPSAPCGRERLGDCYVIEDLLLTSRAPKVLGFCVPPPLPIEEFGELARDNPELMKRLVELLSAAELEPRTRARARAANPSPSPSPSREPEPEPPPADEA